MKGSNLFLLVKIYYTKTKTLILGSVIPEYDNVTEV